MFRHIRNQYRLSLRAGFSRRKSLGRAITTYFKGF